MANLHPLFGAPKALDPAMVKLAAMGGPPLNTVVSVRGPNGELITINDLPTPDTKRWVMRRKAEVVAAVRGGMMSQEDACERYRISIDEFRRWQQLIDNGGLLALRATRFVETPWQMSAPVAELVPMETSLLTSGVTAEPVEAEPPPTSIKVGDVTIDFKAEALIGPNGNPLHLTFKMVQILSLFAERLGGVVTKEMIFERLYHDDKNPPEPKIIDVFVCKVRPLLVAASETVRILTVWGRGYRLVDAPEQST